MKTLFFLKKRMIVCLSMVTLASFLLASCGGGGSSHSGSKSKSKSKNDRIKNNTHFMTY